MVNLKYQLPESFFDEEDRLGFHIDRNRKEIWAVELDMLRELSRVCEELGISYYLDGGTLLGAARDGHFIPWDDDIDVVMLREDYDRFICEAPRAFQYPLFLQTGYTEQNYFRGHSQLRNRNTCAILPHELGKVSFNQGIFLDIFVLDELFDDRVIAQYKERSRLQKFQKRAFGRKHGKPIRRLVKYAIYCLYRARFPDSACYYSKLERIFRTEEKSMYVDYLMLNQSPEQIHHLQRAWYKESMLLPFEDTLFPVPCGYREYLETYYGKDWEIPKIVNSMHNAAGEVIFDTDRSYTEILEELLN